ncbi:hypothetical protein D3C71_1762700 [compost metagenome]
MLGNHHDIRLDTEGFTAKHFTGTTKAADHFIRNDQHVIFAAHRLNLVPICARRHDHAARPHQRFAVKSGYGFRALPEDDIFQFGCQAISKLFIGLARFGIAIVVRTSNVKEAGQRHVKTTLVHLQPG